jgi:hypothetical protein
VAAAGLHLDPRGTRRPHRKTAHREVACIIPPLTDERVRAIVPAVNQPAPAAG